MDIPPLRYAWACDGTRICYAVLAGRGSPFLSVLGPGIAPLTARFQINTYAEFLDRFRCGAPVIQYDFRGFGASDPGKGEASIEQWAQDVHAVVDAIGEPVHLLGNYGFGNTAALFALQHPNEVLSLTLRSPRLHGVYGKPDFVKLLDANFELASLYILRMTYDWVGGQRAEDFVAAQVAGSEAGYLWLRSSRALAETRLADYLPGITVPVHIVANDVEEDRVDALGAAQLLPSTRLTFVRPGPLNAGRADELRRAFDRFWADVSNQREPPGAPELGLTSREAAVLSSIVAGRSNPEIAGMLGISRKTVERHVHNIYAKIDVHNRVEAANWAREHGVV